MSRDKTIQEAIESTLYHAGVSNSGDLAEVIFEEISGWPPNVNTDWKANAQANAAALNTIYEYVGTNIAPIPAQEHMEACATDPVTLAKAIITSLQSYKDTVQYHLEEMMGTVEEYRDMPCSSLRSRMFSALLRARNHFTS